MIFTHLRSFLMALFPGIEVIQGQINRVPEPAGDNFISMVELSRERIATNETEMIDTSFMGVIEDTTLTVTEVFFGEIKAGALIFGAAEGTTIVGGGPFEYEVDIDQITTWRVLSCGVREYTQATKSTIQVDIHGPASTDNIQKLTTIFRSESATDFFSEFTVTPLMCGDPRKLPFLNESQQIEERWSIDLEFEINPVETVPQQFSDEVVVMIQPPPVN